MSAASRHHSAIVLLAITLGTALTAAGSPIVTNWVAYNDHRPGPAPSPVRWGTALRVTPYDMRIGPAGNLTNFFNGQQLPVTMTVTPNGTPDDFGTMVTPYGGTAVSNLFFGIVDISNTNSGIGCRFSANTYVTLTFNNLNPAKRYVFRGSAVRGNYPLRWSVATIFADGWIDAHINGNGGPGVLTSNNFPANLGAGQAAYNSGDNRQGAVVGWDFITPAADGSFSIQCSNYVGQITGGGMADTTFYGYGFCGFLLAEVEASAPAIVTHPVAQTVVEQNRPFSLSVSASGTPLLYQWYKEGSGAIGGATFPTYSVAQAALGDSGNYYAVVYNPIASVTSTVAQVTVYADTNPPSIGTAFAYPTFDSVSQSAFLNQVIIEYNETVETSTAIDTANYQLSNGSVPDSVILTNERTVVLNLADPLDEDTVYTVTVSDVRDLVGNNVSDGTNNPASFRTWARSPGNGLLYEAFNAGAGVDVAALTNSAVYPNNPFFRTNMWAFDSRVAFPDDSHDNYGSRTRGVFIAPVSADYIFYLRSDDRSTVYFNPNGLSASGTIELVAETTGANGDWNKLLSAPVRLRAGQAYYIEGLQKDGTGGDFIKVATRLAGTGIPPLGVPNTAIDASSLMGAAVGFPLAPRDLGGPLTIVQQPAPTMIEENHVVTFSVQVSNPSGLPVFFQWFRDGNRIDGANGPTYSFLATSADDMAVFRVEMAKVGSFIVSENATLTVGADVTKPEVVGVHANSTGDRVVVSFSEQVELNTAQDSANYSISGGIGIVGNPMVDATGTNVILLLDIALVPGNDYTITIENVLDRSGANQMNPVTLPLRPWVLGRGFAFQQLYLNIGGGTAVTDLTGNANFPNAPDQVDFLSTIDGPVDTYDNYGIRLSGWVRAPIDGAYNFYVCSDDGGQLSLSPDNNPAGLVVIAQESSYNGARVWTGDRAGGTRGNPPVNIASNVMLMAQQMYAFEVLAKEGGGGDNAGATWQIPGQPQPANGTPGIPGAFLYSFADPAGSSVTITQQPSSVVDPLPTTATFSVAARSTYAGAPNTRLTYVWQRNDGAGFQDILGAYASSYTVNLSPAESSASFRCLVYAPGASATSAVARASSARLRVRIDPDASGDVVVEWDDPSWRLETSGSLSSPTWTVVSAPNAVSYRVIQPTATGFFRLVLAP